MSFRDLWEQSKKRVHPRDQQEWLRNELPKRLGQAGIQTAKPGGGASDRIVLGITEYNREDLLLLDSVQTASSSVGLVLEVFLLTECKSQSAIDGYVPGIGPVYQSPVVGIWKVGALVDSGSGHAAKELLQSELLQSHRP